MRNTLRNMGVALATIMPSLSIAAEEAGHSASIGPVGAVGVVLGVGLAVMAAATAQGKIASAYLDGASRNPGAEKVMKTQLILSLVFVETLVIFTLGIAFVIAGKI